MEYILLVEKKLLHGAQHMLSQKASSHDYIWVKAMDDKRKQHPKESLHPSL